MVNGVAQRAFGHAEFLFHFFPGLANGRDLDPRKIERTIEDLVIHKQIGLVAGLIEERAADAAMIGVFVDEALTALVDEDPLHQRSRHDPRAGGEEFVHVDRVAASAHAHEDARSVVVLAERIVQTQRFGRIAPQHFLIHAETAGGKDHALARPHILRLVVDPDDQADHTARSVGDQAQRARIGANVDAQRAGAGFEDVDKLAATAPTHELDGMAARCGFGFLGKGPCRFAARPQKRVVFGGFDHLAGNEAALIGNALILQPLIVVEAFARIEADLGGIRIGTTGHHHIFFEIFGAVGEARGLLGIAAAIAADIDFTARQCGCTAAARTRFKQRDAGTGRSRFDRGTGTCRAKSDDGDIGFDVPSRHFSFGKRTNRRNFRHQGSVPLQTDETEKGEAGGCCPLASPYQDAIRRFRAP